MKMRCALAVLALGAASCGQVQTLKRENADLRAQLRDVQRKNRELDERQSKTESELRRIWSRVACNSDSVKDFLRTCEQDGNSCSQFEVGNSFKDFLETQEYVRLYLRPDVPMADNVVKLRQTQLEDQADSNEIHRGTRFIVLILPRSSSAQHEQEAVRMGRQLIRYLRDDIHVPHANAILGPRTLPCNYKRQELLKQRRRIDSRQSTEPPESEATLHVWVFKTECH